MEVYVGGKRIRVDPTLAIGKGGEADIFDIGNGMALKVFKPPNHPDLVGLPNDQQAARERILTHQKKLPAFPKDLPARAITPKELATDKNGMIVGYAMPLLAGHEVLLRYGESSFRNVGIPHEMVVNIFRDLHKTVEGLHGKQVVIGDFNDLNILVRGEEAKIIDADSFQFGPFLCKVFTARFVDPLLCDQRATSPLLIKPHHANSDWYAYAVMLMQSLLFVGPYGGVYRPKKGVLAIAHDARPLHRITIFDPQVKYPKAGINWKTLPDDLLQEFHRIFEKDERGTFPVALLERIRWTTCVACNTRHARGICPECAQAAPAAVREVIQVRGTVTATRVFHTPGSILFATMQEGNLRWLYRENEAFLREDGRAVLHGALDPGMRFRISGKETLVGMAGQLVVLGGESVEQKSVDSFHNLPLFDANDISIYWAQGGQLYRSDTLGPKYIGDVMRNQTLFWVGPKFGFGFSRAGEFEIAFVFDALARGINDSVQLPKIKGQLIDSSCVFGNNRCWFFVTTQEHGKTVNRCFVMNERGVLEASAEAGQGEDSWLGTIRGKCTFGDTLFSATDDGIVRVRTEGTAIVQFQTFPDTEPFVSANSHLFPGKGGMYVVSRQDITLLQIK